MLPGPNVAPGPVGPGLTVRWEPEPPPPDADELAALAAGV
jgi:hypothetical protein